MTELATALPPNGNVAQRPFPHLLYVLHGTQVTGHVALAEADWKSTVFLRQGAPVCVELPDQTDRLDKVLLDEGMLTPRQLRDIEATRIATGQRLGDLLTGAGLIPRAQLAQALKRQLARKLMRLFFPEHAQFALTQGNHPFGTGPDFAVMRVHPRNIIYPGIRASYSSERLDREIQVLRGRSFRMAKTATAHVAQMGFRRDDEAVLGTLWQRPLDLGELERVPAAMGSAKSVVLALLYCDLLEVHPATAQVLPPLVTRPAEPARRPASPSPSPPPSSSRWPAEAASPRAVVPAASSASAALAANLRADILAFAAKLDGMDHFQVLGVRREAREDEIDAAFVQVAKRYHPDRARALGVGDVAAEAARVMSRLIEANMVLSDTKKRALYQRGLNISAADRERALAVLDAEVHFQEGESCLRRGDFEHAEVEFVRAVQGNPGEPQHKALLAWTRFANPRAAHKDQMLADALKTLQVAVHDRPGWARGYYLLGLLWKHKNEIPRAKGAFQMAVNTEPGFFDAERELRLIAMRAKK